MKKRVLLYFIVLCAVFFLKPPVSGAQCSICTRTAQQMGEGPAKGLNSGILYLAFAPFAIVAVIAYRIWKNVRSD